jgi:hypothetical protein
VQQEDGVGAVGRGRLPFDLTHRDHRKSGDLHVLQFDYDLGFRVVYPWLWLLERLCKYRSATQELVV